jgi:RNA polymerase-binding transcription factor DksA
MTDNRTSVSRAATSIHDDSSALERIHAALVERAAALHHRLELLEAELPGEVVDGPRDVGDIEFVRLQYENTRLQLLEVDAALRRFDERTYGRCVDCGEPISIERLEAAPATTRCVRCSGR